MKTCYKCKIEKPLSEFNKNSSRKDGLQSNCKECRKAYYELNRETCLEYQKKYREDNRETCLESQKKCYQENKDRELRRAKKWKQDNRERVSEYKRNWQKSRRESDPLFKLKSNLRNRTFKAFSRCGWSKNSKTKDFLGADWETAKHHIGSRFKKGMSWENFGEWHIDHIIPLASARTEKELIELCHYTNLQPLWAEENLIKGDKIIACRINLI